MYVTVGTGNSHDSLRRMIPTGIEKSDDILRRDNLISDAHVVCPRSKSLGEATNKAFSRFDVYAQKFFFYRFFYYDGLWHFQFAEH